MQMFLDIPCFLDIRMVFFEAHCTMYIWHMNMLLIQSIAYIEQYIVLKYD